MKEGPEAALYTLRMEKIVIELLLIVLANFMIWLVEINAKLTKSLLKV